MQNGIVVILYHQLHQQNYQAIIYDFCDDLFAVVLEDLLQNADDFVLGHTELLLHKAYSVYFVRTGLHGLDFLLRLLVFQRSYQDLLDFAHCPDQLLGEQLRQIWVQLFLVIAGVYKANYQVSQGAAAAQQTVLQLLEHAFQQFDGFRFVLVREVEDVLYDVGVLLD